MHTTGSEHLQVLDSCRYKNVVRFCTGAKENHRNDQKVTQKAVWFHSKKTAWTIGSKHISREMAYSCRGLEPGWTEAQGDAIPPAPIRKLHWSSASNFCVWPQCSTSGFDLTSRVQPLGVFIHWDKLGRELLVSASFVCLEALLQPQHEIKGLSWEETLWPAAFRRLA